MYHSTSPYRDANKTACGAKAVIWITGMTRDKTTLAPESEFNFQHSPENSCVGTVASGEQKQEFLRLPSPLTGGKSQNSQRCANCRHLRDVSGSRPVPVCENKLIRSEGDTDYILEGG